MQPVQQSYYQQPQQPQGYPQTSQYRQQIPMAMGAPSHSNGMAAPAAVAPTQEREDFLPPK